MTVRRIGLIADTHIPEACSELPPQAYQALEGCELIVHCGDLHTIEVVDWLDRLAPTIVTRGNGDSVRPRVRRPGVPHDPRVVDTHTFEIEGLRIGATHDLAHIEARRDRDEVKAVLARSFGGDVDIAVSGHTHVPMVWGLEDGTAVVNPGSPTMPYGYLGLIGTIGYIDVDDGRFEIRIVDLRTGADQLRLAGPAVHQLERGPRPTGGR